MEVLYITYDGLMEPLGQSQVLQYLLQLAKTYQITLISYEKPHDWANSIERVALASKVRAAGILWLPLRYHKSPTLPATAFDLAVGLVICIYIVLTRRIRIVHARSYVPSILALILKVLFGMRFIFDMRGFWADEKVDAGQWTKSSQLYKAAKWFERLFLEQADVVVSLSHAGVAAMKQFHFLQDRLPRFEVIPTCTNLDHFRPRPTSASRRNHNFVLGYVGTASGWYIFDPALECFLVLREIKPNARMVILNRGEHSFIQERLSAHHISQEWVDIRAVPYIEMAAEMVCMNAGIFFIKPVFSKVASSPTKLGEFLACGVPCLSNAGVGDMAQILESGRVGVVLREFSATAQQKAVRELLDLVNDPDVANRCVEAAQRYFSLQDGVESYSQIYNSLR